jgi:hypothetical protein
MQNKYKVTASEVILYKDEVVANSSDEAISLFKQFKEQKALDTFEDFKIHSVEIVS